jgi:hypothetical protein
MAVEADLVAYLASAGLGLTAGATLFEGPPVELPDNVVVITHTGGEAPGSDDGNEVMGPSLEAPGYEIVRIQLFVRHTVKATAVSTALACHAKLAGLHSQTLSTRTYYRIDSMDGEPYSLAQDQNGRWRMVSNYTVRKARG